MGRYKAFIVALILLVAGLPVAASASESVIVNQYNDIEEIDHSDLRKIFLGKKTRWTTGKITLVIMPFDSIEHKDFVKEFLGILPSRYKREVERKISSGYLDKPIVVSTDYEMFKEVSRERGAIGYIDNTIIILQDDKVKRLTVINSEQ